MRDKAAISPPRAAEANASLLRNAIIEELDDAVISKDLSGIITTWNKAASRLLGYSAEEILGSSIYRIVPEERHSEENQIFRRLRGGEKIQDFETVRLTKTGRRIDVSVTISPICDAGGEVIGASNVLRDIRERKSAEAALRRSEAFNRSLIKSSRDCLKLLSLEGHLLWMNDEGQKLLCIRDLSQVLGKSWIEFWDAEEDREAAKQAVASAAAGGSGSFTAMYRVSGEERWFDVLLSPVRGPNGRPEKLLAASRDITDRREFEHNLRQSREQLALVSNSVPALISYVDSGSRYQFCNRAYTEWFGLPPDAIIGHEMREVLGEEAWIALESYVRAALAGRRQEFEIEAQYARGGTRWIHATYTPHRNATGEVDGVTNLVLDITARKKAEEALRESEKRFRSFVEATAHVVWRMNPQGEVDIPNPSWNAFTGQTDAEAAGVGWLNAVHPEDRGTVAKAWQRASSAKTTYEAEYRLRLASGEWHFILARGVPLFEEDGRLVEYIGTCMDVTEQRRAEAELQKSREDLAHELHMTSALHKLAVEFVTWQNLNTALQQVLQTALSITGTDRGTLQLFNPSTGTLELRAACGFSDEWQRFYRTVHGPGATCGEAMRRGQRVIVQDIRSNPVFAGTAALEVQLKEGVMAVQSTPLMGRGGQFLGMLSTHFREPHTPSERQLHWLDLLAWQAADLIEFAHAQQRLQRNESDLREREAVLRTVTNEARVGLVMVDQQRRYLFANQTFADVFGLPNDDIVGKQVSDVLAPVYDQIKPNLDRGLAGERVSYELHVHRHPKTGEERFYEVVYEPRVQDTANPYVIIVLADVTERKRTEQRLEKLVAERTASLRETVGELEAFSYTIAHDMRAPLRAMQSFAGILKEDYGRELSPDAKALLDRIGTSANRLDHLIQDVLNYSKIVRADLHTEPVDTHALIEEIIQAYPNLHPGVADIPISTRLPTVLGNRAALTQVFSNLLGNAVKFVAPGVRPRVAIRSEAAPVSRLNGEPSTRKSGSSPLHRNGSRFVRLWFEDNGVGIERQEIPKLFNMFYRGHSPGQYEGTGMGLAIARKAVERMGGRVGVESQREQGSRFWVELRLAS